MFGKNEYICVSSPGSFRKEKANDDLHIIDLGIEEAIEATETGFALVIFGEQNFDN